MMSFRALGNFRRMMASMNGPAGAYDSALPRSAIAVSEFEAGGKFDQTPQLPQTSSERDAERANLITKAVQYILANTDETDRLRIVELLQKQPEDAFESMAGDAAGGFYQRFPEARGLRILPR
jgi:hypothetical protein